MNHPIKQYIICETKGIKSMKKLILLIALFPALITAAVLPYYPDTVAMHFNFSGEIDRYGSKYFLFIFPAIIFFFGLIGMLAIRHYSKVISGESKELARSKTNAKAIFIIFASGMIFYALMHLQILYVTYQSTLRDNYKLQIDFFQTLNAILSIYIIVISNFMPKTESNSIIGFRTTWSRYNDVTWRKTQHFGSRLFMISGFLSLILGLIAPKSLHFMPIVIFLLLASVLIILYSYYVYREEIQNKSPNK